MRNSFIKTLVKSAEHNKNIVLVVGDLGYSVVEPFANKFPDRFINAGVAEQNMTGLASGMASEGYHVFTYSIANFSSFRCAEQIRNDIDYHNLPVTVVAVGGGLAYGNLGYSHHAIQDFSLMRSFPNVIIVAPADPLEMEGCVKFLIKNPQPSYLRINKSGEKKILNKNFRLNPGTVNIYNGNIKTKNIILTTGAVLDLAIDIWKSNKNLMQEWCVGSIPIWGEPFRKKIKQDLSWFNKIVTIEEHLIAGGFGSFLLESNLDCKINCLDKKVCNEVGTQEYLKNMFGLKKDISLVLN